jgi:hypothetical protein
MQRKLSGPRGMARLGLAGILFLAVLASVAGHAVAQPPSSEVINIVQNGVSLRDMAVGMPYMLYRPMDVNAVRPGGDALGMGGAYLATASGTIALGWNPAGLADLERLSFSFDGYERSASGTVSEHPAQLIIPQLSTLDFLNYEATRKGGFVPNFIALGAPLWTSGERRLVGAFGWRHAAEMAIPEQTVSELGTTGATFPVVFSFDRTEKGSLEAFSTALGFRVGPKLSLGATANILDGGLNANTDERFTVVGSPLRGTIRSRHRYSGFSSEFGARYQSPAPFGWPTSLAFRVSPGYTMKVRSGSFTSEPIVAPGSPVINVTGTFADYDLQVPLTLGGGVAIRPTPRLLLAADWNRQAWSKAKVVYKTVSVGGVVQPAPDSMGLPLADVSTLHFGAEYKLFRTRWGEVPVRVGFRTAPQGYLDPDRADVRADTIEVSGSRVVQVSSTGHYYGKQPKANAYSFGVSLDTPGIRYDLGFETISYEHRKWFFDLPYDAILNPSMSIVTVTQKVSRYRLSATCSF